MTRDPRALAVLLAGLCALFAGVGLFVGFAIWGDRDGDGIELDLGEAGERWPWSESAPLVIYPYWDEGVDFDFGDDKE